MDSFLTLNFNPSFGTGRWRYIHPKASVRRRSENDCNAPTPRTLPEAFLKQLHRLFHEFTFNRRGCFLHTPVKIRIKSGRTASHRPH